VLPSSFLTSSDRLAPLTAMTQPESSPPNSAPAAVDDGYQSNDKDLQQLALSDSEYRLHTWEDLTAIIRPPPLHPSPWLAGTNKLTYPRREPPRRSESHPVRFEALHRLVERDSCGVWVHTEVCVERKTGMGGS